MKQHLEHFETLTSYISCATLDGKLQIGWRSDLATSSLVSAFSARRVIKGTRFPATQR